MADQLWLRKATLIVKKGDRGRDLSEMRFRFATQQFDLEAPNHCAIRVYNLADETVREIRSEYDSVVLQAGYEDGPFGTIFAGTLKQFGLGRESAIDSYLDLLVADGDLGYNFGVIASTLAPGRDLTDVVDAAAKAMNAPIKFIPVDFALGQKLIRGKTLFGMARDVMRDAARGQDAAWSIQNGQVQLIPLTKYLPGEAVVLNAATGMVGIPELTNNGVRIRTLLNPNIRVGGLVKIDNAALNAVVQRNPEDLTQYNSWFDPNHLAKINADGLYQVLQVEHFGGPREHEFYSDVTMLAVDSSSGTVKAYG